MYNRRNFLKCTALLGASATLPLQLLAENSVLPKPTSDGLLALPYAEKMKRTKAPRVITIPDVGEYKVLKGDFHIHTLFSDGEVMPKDRILEAIDNGLDVISITDHIEYRIHLGGQGRGLKLIEHNDDHNFPYNLAKPLAEERNIILVPGTEITKSTLPPGHLNALFVKDVNAIAAEVKDWRKMVDVAVEQGAFIQWNHPGWVAPTSGGLKENEPMRFFDEHKELCKKGHLHGIEAFNYTEFYPIVLDWFNEWDLAPMANSDIHEAEWNLYGHHSTLRPITLILAKERSADSVREAFFAKRTIGWVANMIFGKPPLVEQLFHACIEIKRDSNRLILLNRSDIVCLFDSNGSVQELPAKGQLELTDSPKLIVRNWLIGMNKPLEIMVG